MCSDGLKKVTLELGGNCPFVVFDDANLDEAADGTIHRKANRAFILTSMLALMGLKWRNAGQACISANRVYVQSGVYDKFADILHNRTARLVMGHGDTASSTIGPVTTPQSLDRIVAQVEDAKKCGAKILFGGERVKDTTGFFFQPTIIINAKKEMRITQEETFAPILTLYKFETEEEAVQAANDTSVSGNSPVHVQLLNFFFRWVWHHTCSQKILTEDGDSWRISKLG